MGKPAARIGDMHVCPMFDGPKPHVGGPITGPGVPTVLIGGVPAATMGDMCTCVGPPDTIILGSVGVFIGGKPAARMGDMCAHGGTIILGLPTVLIGEAGGGGGGGMSVMPVTVLMEMMPKMPAAVQQKMAQVVTMKEAAKNGTPFCEKCAAGAAAPAKSAPQAAVQKGSQNPQSQLMPSSGARTDDNEGQREKAIRILKQCPKCSCGNIMLGPVSSLYGMAGEFQSGKIGDHYEQVIDKLKQPATLERLQEIADRETEFWKSKDGTTSGAVIPAVARYQILKLRFLASGCGSAF